MRFEELLDDLREKTFEEVVKDITDIPVGFNGTKKEVKELLLKLLDKDKKNNAGAFDYGTETVDEIDDNGTKSNTYATYFSYHIDYTAILLNDISLIC